MSSTWVSAGYQLEVRGDAAVDREEPLVDDAGQREEVEALHEEVIDLLVVLVETLAAEVEEVGHLAALVVSADEGYGVGEGDLERVEQDEHFDRKRSAVDEVAQEEVLRVLRVAADLQDPLQVVVLPVYVAHHRYRVLQVYQVAFVFCLALSTQDLVRLVDQRLDVRLLDAAFAVQVLLQQSPVGLF